MAPDSRRRGSAGHMAAASLGKLENIAAAGRDVGGLVTSQCLRAQ